MGQRFRNETNADSSLSPSEHAQEQRVPGAFSAGMTSEAFPFITGVPQNVSFYLTSVG